MTLRDQLLVLILSERPRNKPALVLAGDHEPHDETALRLSVAREVTPVVSLSEGRNTAEESRRAVRQIGDQVILCTSAFHQLRAFLTFVRALQDAGRDREVKVWNLPVWTPRAPMREEFHKISVYQDKGDCASYQDGLAYLEWRGP